MEKTELCYLLTGANLGDRFGTLDKAIRLIEARIGSINAVSSLYETAAWGVEQQPDYLNQAISVQTKLPPQELLDEILRIEESLGRVRRVKWGSRTIDIDILFYGNQIINTPSLSIPHAQLHRRNFVLIPLLELAPELVHPSMGKTIEELYWDCPDELDVIQLEMEHSQDAFSITQPKNLKK